MDRAIFIKCGKHAKVNQSKVLLKDVAEVYCADAVLANKAKVVPITHLKKVGSRKVLSVLFVMAQVQKDLPGVVFQSVGETDMIVEWEQKPKMELIKIVAVSLIAFFGTAFTIMAFHNDIGIRAVFEEIYYITRGMAPEGVGILEFSYCLGLFLGITVFFNHFGKKKFTKDPTPVNVAMHTYEMDVNQAIIENADRQGVEECE
jgi:stage V sporulation protein AA